MEGAFLTGDQIIKQAALQAIELYSGSIGARRTRAEAYRRLGMVKEAEADLEHIGESKRQLDLVEHMPWIGEVNAVWRQVGREVGAEFGFRVPGTDHSAFGAALVRKTGKWTITLEYGAERTYVYEDYDSKTKTLMKAAANTEATFQFEIAFGLWGRNGSIEIEGRPYDIKSNITNKVRELLANERIRELIPEALGRSSLGLDESQLSLAERSGEKAPDNWMLPIRDPSRLRALFRLFEAVLNQLDQLPQLSALEHEKAQQLSARERKKTQRSEHWLLQQHRKQRLRARNKDCTALRKLGIDARVLELDPLTPQPTGIEDGLKADGWIEIAEGPIRWVEPGLGHCHVPDSRLGPDFEFPYTEVYSERQKRFPVFGRVESVQWYDGSGGAAGPRDADFSELVAGFLSQNTTATGALMLAGVDLSVFLDPDRGTWIVHQTGWYRWTRPLWDCCQAIAKALLAMPIPTEE